MQHRMLVRRPAADLVRTPTVLLVALVLSTTIAGCASLSRVRPAIPDPARSEEIKEDSPESTEAEAPSETAEIAKPTEEEASKEPTVSSLTLETNEKVEKWIRYFTITDRERFQRFINRGQKYRNVVEDVLIENDLPPELYFLALIESGYRNHATSSARAVGVWQFMPATGRRYGLQINDYVDERRDPIRATEAAAKYLRDLYNIFGSWPLAMAGYNAGEYGVIRSILKGKSRDYWTLVSLGVLPRETSEYVPKLMAAATIGADLEKYGFKVEPGEEYPELEAIEIPARIRFADLATRSGLTTEKLREFNPHLKGDRTPGHLSDYEIWFPKKNVTIIQPQLALLNKLSPGVSKSARRAVARSSSSQTRNYHRVRPGENLSLIARRYGRSVNYLIKVNSLRSASRIYAGMDLRITSKSYHPQSVLRYRVRRGDNLDRIARKYGLSVKQVKSDNSLENSRIIPGQVLMIRRDRS